MEMLNGRRTVLALPAGSPLLSTLGVPRFPRHRHTTTIARLRRLVISRCRSAQPATACQSRCGRRLPRCQRSQCQHKYTFWVFQFGPLNRFNARFASRFEPYQRLPGQVRAWLPIASTKPMPHHHSAGWYSSATSPTVSATRVICLLAAASVSAFV